MEKNTFRSATGGCDIVTFSMEPAGEVKAAVQLMHGMAEHASRYERFADFLNGKGIALYAMDMASHGESRRDDGVKGYFGDEGGWDALIADMKTLHDMTRPIHPDVPFVLMGHSMGSFLARSYAARHPEDHSAYIFSGTAGRNPAVPVAKMLAVQEIRKQGGEHCSERLNGLSFGSYNKAFRPNRTEFDWLSRDNAQVDKYVADDDCGFCFTAGGFSALFDGLKEIQSADWAAKVPNRPILMISGDSDPVGGSGKGVRQVAKSLTDTGHDVELHLYEGARHEVLNELCADQVMDDIYAFISRVK